MRHFETFEIILAGQGCLFTGKIEEDEGTILIEAFDPMEGEPMLPVLLAYPTMGKLGEAIYNKLPVAGECRIVAVRCEDAKPVQTVYFSI